MKYFAAGIVLILIFWFLSESSFVNPPKRSAEFLNKATSFYQKENLKFKIKENNKVTITTPPEVFHPEDVSKSISKMNEYYEVSQEDMINNFPAIKVEQKKLDMALARFDQKVDPAFKLEPAFRVTLSAYLDIAPKDLSEAAWIEAQIPSKTWKELAHISESNDFRVLLLNGKLSKEEILLLLKKNSKTK